jgi:hypothetical protein
MKFSKNKNNHFQNCQMLHILILMKEHKGKEKPIGKGVK